MSQASSTGKDGDQWLPHRIAATSAAPGPPVLIRQVAAGDRPALAEMLARCSDQTRQRRFHKYVSYFTDPYLTEALARGAAHFALLAQAGQAVAGLASCVTTGRGSAELAVLVEDSWQRLGVGARLLSQLVAHADQSGQARLKAWVLASQAWVLPVLGGYGTCEAWLRHGVFEVTVHRSGAVNTGAVFPS